MLGCWITVFDLLCRLHLKVEVLDSVQCSVFDTSRVATQTYRTAQSYLRLYRWGLRFRIITLSRIGLWCVVDSSESVVLGSSNSIVPFVYTTNNDQFKYIFYLHCLQFKSIAGIQTVRPHSPVPANQQVSPLLNYFALHSLIICPNICSL